MEKNILKIQFTIDVSCRMLNHCIKCTRLTGSPPSVRFLSRLKITTHKQSSSTTLPARFIPLLRQCEISPQRVLIKSNLIIKRSMSSLPHSLPPVIHHVEKHEFTLTIPGHQPAYLRYTYNNSNSNRSNAIFKKHYITSHSKLSLMVSIAA